MEPLPYHGGMTVYVLALLIGVVAGLRAMTAPATVSWAAHLGWLDLSGSWLAFLGHACGVPVYTGLPFGHVRDKITLPVGARASLGARDGAATLAFSDYAPGRA